MKAFVEDDPFFRIIQIVDSISNYNRRHVERLLKPLNMTYSQMAVLQLLNHTDGITQKELSDLSRKDTTNIMVICDSLEKRGWINRVIDQNDRRARRICLTDKGKQAHNDGQKILQAGIRFMREKTPVEEIRKVQPFLEELNKNIKNLYEGMIEETD